MLSWMFHDFSWWCKESVLMLPWCCCTPVFQMADDPVHGGGHDGAVWGVLGGGPQPGTVLDNMFYLVYQCFHLSNDHQGWQGWHLGSHDGDVRGVPGGCLALCCIACDILYCVSEESTIEIIWRLCVVVNMENSLLLNTQTNCWLFNFGHQWRVNLSTIK